MERREFIKLVGMTVLIQAVPFNSLKFLAPHKTKLQFALYDVDGLSRFPVYGEDGSLSPSTVSWLFTIDGKTAWGFDQTKQSIAEAEDDFAAALAELNQRRVS
jgi:hypothetical protein